MCDAPHVLPAPVRHYPEFPLSATCPTPGRTLVSRVRHAATRRAPAALAASVALLGFGAAAAQAATPATMDDVQLTDAFVAPITANEYRCTPEPGGRLIYNTQVPFVAGPNPATEDPQGTNTPGAAGYVPANRRSRDTMTPDFQAGAVNDLCFGFTLSPNIEDGMLKTPTSGTAGFRIQEDPPVRDISGTHTWTTGSDDDLKSATIELPTGFLGNPDAIPTCSAAQLGLGNYGNATCPADSQVGTTFARVTVKAGLSLAHTVGGGRSTIWTGTLQDSGAVFNLEHGPNEIGRLAVVIQPANGVTPVKFVVPLELTPDGRVRTTVENAPRLAYNADDVDPDTGALDPSAVPYPIYLESFAIRAWGKDTSGPNSRQLPADFSEWGTDCSKPLTAKVAIETYDGFTSSKQSNGVQLTGCDNLEFHPDLKVETTEKKPGVPTGTKIDLTLGQNSVNGLRTALLKDASVTLPAGLEIGAQVGSGTSGLPLCSAAQFNKDSSAPSGCPAGSKQGTATIITPLQTRPFEGSVYLGQQPAVGELPPLYLEAAPQGADAPTAPRIKLVGTVKVDENGNLTTTFTDAPQLRFSELRLEFPSGPNALFTTPRTCGTTTGSSSFTSWAKPTTPVPVTSSLTINEDCGAVAFAPSFTMAPANAAVGISSPTKITISRPDRSPWLKDVKVTLPAGFIADLKLATECSKADAAAGSCPESSRMGTVTTVAGAGEKPLSLTGSMYLVERDEGAVAGVAIVVHAKIGELDLGNVVVPGRINLSPTDAGLTLITTAPLRFKGIALNLRSIVVDLDRENFSLNPTACGPLRATAELTGDGGQTAAPTADVTYTGCADLPFEPGFEAKLSGETGPLGHPQLDVTMTPRAGDSNLKGVRVVLPQGVATDLKNLKAVCSVDAFQSGTCGDETKVGNVSATVSITNDVITGSVHLVRIEGTALPGLGLNLTGRYAVRLLSTVKIDKDKRLVTEFASIPDLPMRSVHLTVAGGAKSPLQLSSIACTADTAWQATLASQGGKTRQVDIPVPCAKKADPKQTLTWSAKTGLKVTLTSPTGLKIKSAKVTLPTGFKLKKGKTLKKNLKLTASGGKAKGKNTSTSFAVVASGAGPTKVTFALKTKGYTLPKSYKNKLKKGKKIKLKTRIVLSDGTVVAKTITVKTK